MSQSLPNSIITSTGYINNLNILMLFCDPNNSDITSLLNCHGVFIKGSSVGNIVYARYTNAMENMAMINGLAHMLGVLMWECGDWSGDCLPTLCTLADCIQQKQQCMLYNRALYSRHCYFCLQSSYMHAYISNNRNA